MRGSLREGSKEWRSSSTLRFRDYVFMLQRCKLSKARYLALDMRNSRVSRSLSTVSDFCCLLNCEVIVMDDLSLDSDRWSCSFDLWDCSCRKVWYARLSCDKFFTLICSVISYCIALHLFACSIFDSYAALRHFSAFASFSFRFSVISICRSKARFSYSIGL